MISMGLVNMPSMECYWSKKTLYAYDFVKRNITRSRFFLLLRMLHFNDNETFEQNRRLHKIEPILDMLKNNFKSVYSPGEKLVVDESLVPFRGRIFFRQYIPGKSHKYGIKLYKLCTVNGYTWNFEVYTGNLSNVPEHNHSESIVLKLAKPLLKNGATIYADNYYSSVPLAEKLLQEKTYYCGTVRKNRKLLPQDVMSAKLKRGEVTGKMNSKGVKICHWKDKRDVFTLSTCPEHDVQLVPTGKKNRMGEEVMKHGCITDYNAAKIGVDKSDQMTFYNSVLRKSTKWYRKLAIELLLGTSIVNAWVIYNQFCLPQRRRKMSILKFKESLAMSLICGIAKENLNPGPGRSNISGKRKSHELVEADGPKSKKRKRCLSCYSQIANAEGTKVARSKTRKVNTYCDTCENKPYLCVSCFNLKHSISS
ncbi:piggyBac transposable element-derived protein 4-like [Hyalella azteca]|uniref:PiggyBac transposable element-derived protein 4-like n=1 Tax=Hyalella azteca TaxID=294128 RepID=A0A979FQ87_HYAAZ|nr:piggyBac transposable element-derived protein 4-like [Hyalella azteca]